MNKKALKAINESRYVLVITHINPDPDTISCALALSNYFYENKIKHKVFNKMRELPNNLDYLPRFEKITDQLPKFYDLIIYVDCGDINRPAITLPNDIKSINIDHHKSNDDYANINIVDFNKASTAEVLYNFFIENELDISKNTAMCLYTGIYDDSIQFSTPRTDASTFAIVNHLVTKGIDPSFIANKLNNRQSLAKFRLLPKVLESLELHNEGEIASIYVLQEWLDETGASYKDCDDAVNMVLSIGIVNIAIFLRAANDKVRISLRSKDDTDVSKIANIFNGGGHTNAAGCSYYGVDVLKAKNAVVQCIKEIKIEEKK